MNALYTLTSRILALLTIMTITVCSCKKDGNSNSSNPESNALTSGVWKLQKIETKSADGTWGIPYYSDGPTDNNQITYTFLSNGTFTEIANGATYVGTWILSADKTQLTLSALRDGGTVSSTFTITVLNTSTLQWLITSAERETYGH